MMWIYFIWLAMVGACVGSFLNVVIYRLPEGKSIVTPGSHCPKCGHMLRWWENIPIFAWFYLRGRCTQCKTQFSFQYAAIEMFCSVLFAGIFAVYYMTDLRPAFADLGLGDTWLVLAMHLVLLGGLVAATMIDARLFIIPLSIPWLITAVALVALPTAVYLAQPSLERVVPTVNALGVHGAIGGVVGLAVALVLLYFKVLPQSFSDQAADTMPLDPGASEEPLTADEKQAQNESFLAYPHARREVLKELLFVSLPLIGALIGVLAVPSDGNNPLGGYHEVVLAAAGVVCGYLVGGGVVWFTRIFGTLGFGKEAMGLGDVHLLAAIGAVLGPLDAVLIFFIAPFLGLAYVAIAIGVSRIAKGQVRIIPYGPYLAGATLVVMVARDLLPI